MWLFGSFQRRPDGCHGTKIGDSARSAVLPKRAILLFLHPSRSGSAQHAGAAGRRIGVVHAALRRRLWAWPSPSRHGSRRADAGPGNRVGSDEAPQDWQLSGCQLPGKTVLSDQRWIAWAFWIEERRDVG